MCQSLNLCRVENGVSYLDVFINRLQDNIIQRFFFYNVKRPNDGRLLLVSKYTSVHLYDWHKIMHSFFSFNSLKKKKVLNRNVVLVPAVSFSRVSFIDMPAVLNEYILFQLQSGVWRAVQNTIFARALSNNILLAESKCRKPGSYCQS